MATPMNPRAPQRRVDLLRSIPLEWVLRACGAQPDHADRRKWHTAQGTLSIHGAKFINWNRGVGGGGAIDLVIHLNRCRFGQALEWLQSHFPDANQSEDTQPSVRSELKLPPSDPAQLQRVQDYLIHQRAIPAQVVDILVRSGSLYADGRTNAVFVLRGPENLPVGAELRGTGATRWHGMAPGSRKDQGCFASPSLRAQGEGIILCESAIDAISCSLLHPHHRCLSTAGARPNPAWLGSLLQPGALVYCGFDADPTGDAMAQAMIGLHPSIQRLRPTCHDWNDRLRSRS